MKKSELHTSCEGCEHKTCENMEDYLLGVPLINHPTICVPCFSNRNGVRKNWTTKQPEPAEQVTNWEYGKDGLTQQFSPCGRARCKFRVEAATPKES